MKMEQMERAVKVAVKIKEIENELERFGKVKECGRIIMRDADSNFYITVSKLETMEEIIKTAIFSKNLELMELWKEFEEL